MRGTYSSFQPDHFDINLQLSLKKIRMLDQMIFLKNQLHLIKAQLFLKFMPFGAQSLSFMLKMSLHSKKIENTVLS